MTTQRCPGPSSLAAFTATDRADPLEQPVHGPATNRQVNRQCEGLETCPFSLPPSPHSKPSSLMSLRISWKESLSLHLYHLSTTERSITVATKSRPMPSTCKVEAHHHPSTLPHSPTLSRPDIRQYPHSVPQVQQESSRLDPRQQSAGTKHVSCTTLTHPHPHPQTFTLGVFSFIFLPIPVTVPPVPAPITTMSTCPSH